MAAKAIQAHQEVNFTNRYLDGELAVSLASDFDCSLVTITRTVKRLGLPVRPVGGQRRTLSAEEGTLVLQQWCRGVALYQIAKDVQASSDFVARFLTAHGEDVGDYPRRIKGPKNAKWTGGSYIQDGYRNVRIYEDDPMFCMVTSTGYVLEHRLVMARSIGRPLRSDETVHHIDGNRLHNAIDNLQLRSGHHGSGIAMECADCGSHNVIPVPLAPSDQKFNVFTHFMNAV